MADSMKSLLRLLGDRQKLTEMVMRRKDDLKYWAGFLVFLVFVFLFLSDGDFSFLLTMAGSMQMFGFLLIFFKVRSQKSSSGVSLKTLQLYCIVFVSRLSSILFHDGYLPFDRSGDWFYQAVEVLSLLTCIGVIYLVRVPFKSTYDAHHDTLPEYFLAGPTFVVACLLHPNLNAFLPADIAWTYALYLEAVTIMPQLFMFTKKGGEIESFTTHFVAAQGISRLLSFTFWLFSYHELNDKTTIHGAYIGTFVILAQLLQLVLMGDFFYHYFRSLRRGIPMVLPAVEV